MNTKYAFFYFQEMSYMYLTIGRCRRDHMALISTDVVFIREQQQTYLITTTMIKVNNHYLMKIMIIWINKVPSIQEICSEVL